MHKVHDSVPSEHILRQIIVNSHEGVLIVDRAAIAVYANQHMQEILGRSSHEIVGHSFQEFMTSEGWSEWQSRLKNRKNGLAEDYEIHLVKKDGSSVWAVVSAAPLYDEKGLWNGSVGMLRDAIVTRDASPFLAAREEALKHATINLEKTISERTQELRQSKAFLDSLIENIPNMVFVKDAKNLRFVQFNKAGEDLLGFSRVDLIGKNVYDLFPKEQAARFTSQDRAALAGREIVDIPDEIIFTRLKGKRILHAKKIPIFGKDGNPEYLLGIAEDITERKKADEERMRIDREQAAVEERDKASREFLTIASHELKTPMTSLRMQLQMAIRNLTITGKPPTTEKLKSVLEISALQVDRLTRLIEDLLDVSRVQSGKLSFYLEEVDLSSLVTDILARYREPMEESACHLEVQVEENVCAIADRGRIEQVIVNLISNALKYAPGSELQVKLKKIGEIAKIEVVDRGPGIDPHLQTRIFERFGRATSSRNIAGLGLGLFISQQIVEAHGGKILVESKVGHGSNFIIVLPLNPTTRPTVDKFTYTAQADAKVERENANDPPH